MLFLTSHLLLAQCLLLAQGDWPDQFALTLPLVYMTVVITLPVVGYVYLVIDVREYLRRLRGWLVHVSSYAGVRGTPDWLTRGPAALSALGLTMNCTEADLLAAYRRKVKRLHPDHGGDRKKFLRFQAQFEALVEEIRQQ